MALNLLKFVKHDDPVCGRSDVFEVIIETFEQVGVVFAQVIAGWCRRRLADDARKSLASESEAKVHQFQDICNFRLGERGDLERARSVALLQTFAS